MTYPHCVLAGEQKNKTITYSKIPYRKNPQPE